jgi:hypothetical protein
MPCSRRLWNKALTGRTRSGLAICRYGLRRDLSMIQPGAASSVCSEIRVVPLYDRCVEVVIFHRTVRSADRVAARPGFALQRGQPDPEAGTASGLTPRSAGDRRTYVPIRFARDCEGHGLGAFPRVPQPCKRGLRSDGECRRRRMP